jgi:hypothetical protein
MDVTLPLLFSELGNLCLQNLEELSDLVSLANADLETTINAARKLYLCYAIPKENSSRIITILTCCWSN